jgi:hypothetical protein
VGAQASRLHFGVTLGNRGLSPIYATGGILSAAVDGIKVAEAVALSIVGQPKS